MLQVAVGLFAVVAVALAGVWAVTTLGDGGDATGEPTPSTSPTGAAVDPQPAHVLTTFDEAGTGVADQVMILAVDAASGAGTVVLVPATLVADVPGHGLLQLGEAFRIGGGALVEVSLANLLGVDFDGSLEVSRQGWSALFTRVGDITLDVPEQLVEVADDGSREVRFRPGEQVLDGPRVAEYLTLREPGETPLQRFPRVQRVLEALFDRFAGDAASVEAVFADGAPMLDTPVPDEIRALFTDLAAAREAGDLEVRSLPVTAVGTADDSSYRVDADRAGMLVAERLAASRPASAGAEGRRVQILNGNGIPGIGQQVAEQLQPGGFTLVDPGNAASFDVPTTRIVVYEDTPSQLAAAREIRDLLGVGEIEVSEVPVSVVDITVIVGLDYPP